MGAAARRALAGLAMAVGAIVPCPPAEAAPPHLVVRSDSGTIGIRLMEAPVSERANPRAYRYIVDHVRPGTVLSRRVEISNMSAQAHRIDVSAGAAAVANGAFSFADSAGNELTSWISFDRTVVRLRPWQLQPVTVTIRVPRDATGGEHYGVIWAAAAARPAGGGVTAVNRVGVRVYLDVGPGGAPRSDFTVGEVTAARAANGSPSVSVAVRNTGGRAIDVAGTMDLTDGPGGLRVARTASLAPATLRPGESGVVVFAAPATAPNGPWRASVELASGTIRRTVTAVVTFPDPAGPARAGRLLTPHWAWIVLAGGTVLAAVGVLVARILVRRRRRPLSETAPAPERTGV